MHCSTWDQHTADRKSNLGSQIIWKTSSDLILAQKCQVILNFRCRGICLLMRLWKTCFHVLALFPLWATFSCALQFHELKPVREECGNLLGVSPRFGTVLKMICFGMINFFLLLIAKIHLNLTSFLFQFGNASVRDG